METMTDFIFLGSKIIADSDCRHKIKRPLLLGRKAVTNLDSILKGRGTRDQIANIHWIIEKAREFQKNIYLYFIDRINSSRDGNTRPLYLPPEKSVCRSRSNS